MDVVAKGKVLAIKEDKAIVNVEGRQKTVNIRKDVKIKRGDKVTIAFNTIVDKDRT